jgi:nitrogen fixation NifU-like protein
MLGDDVLNDELYREVILDHFKNPRNRGRMADPTVHVSGKNPLCGDQLELSLRIEGDKILESKIEAHGCSISKASASMMSEAIQDRSLQDAEKFTALFKQMMLQNGTADAFPDAMEDLKALEGVKQYPVRIKCALLPWNALLQAIQERKSNGHR